MRTAYTSISPISTSYATIHHLFQLQHLDVDRVIVCVWDSFAYEHPGFHARVDPSRSRREQLENEVRVIEGLLRSLDIDFRITYLSDSWNRLFRKNHPNQAFSRILSSITFRDIKEKSAYQYPYFDDFTLAKMNYIIADFLIATYLHEIHPELATAPASVYLSGERLRVFGKTITSTLHKHDATVDIPEIAFVKDFPFITDPTSHLLPSIEMSLQTIHDIVRAYLAKHKPDSTWLKEFFLVLGDIVKPSDYRLDGATTTSHALLNALAKEPSRTADVITENLVHYFANLREFAKPTETRTTKNLLVTNAKSFDASVRPLNELKLSILSLCDGRRTSFEIAKELDVPLPTVSVYFGRLRQMGLISPDRRPKRLVKHIVVDLEGMGPGINTNQ